MANARMPDEFLETVAHHFPPEQPVGPARLLGGCLKSWSDIKRNWSEPHMGGGVGTWPPRQFVESFRITFFAAGGRITAADSTAGVNEGEASSEESEDVVDYDEEAVLREIEQMELESPPESA